MTSQCCKSVLQLAYALKSVILRIEAMIDPPGPGKQVCFVSFDFTWNQLKDFK